MLRSLVYNPKAVGLFYLLLIPVFGLIYYFFPSNWGRELSFIESHYFSIVTITTLGYGEITPQTDFGRVLTATEALLGILTIGMFLNAVAQSLEERREATRKSVAKAHLLAQYKQWRKDLVAAVLRAVKGNYSIDYELSLNLIDFRAFRDYFKGEKLDAVFNGVEGEAGIVEDIFVLSEIFSQQVIVALSKIETENAKSLALLTHLAQHPRLIQNLDIYKNDQPKYITSHIYEILAMYSSVEGPFDDDIVENAISTL